MRKQTQTPFYYEVKELYAQGKSKKEARKIITKNLGATGEEFDYAWFRVQKNALQRKRRGGRIFGAVLIRQEKEKALRQESVLKIVDLYRSNISYEDIAKAVSKPVSTVGGIVLTLIKSGVLEKRSLIRSNCHPRLEEIKKLLLEGNSFGRVAMLMKDSTVTRNVVGGIYERHVRKIQPRDSCVKAKERANQGGIASVVDGGKSRISTGIPLAIHNPNHDWSLKRSDLFCPDGPYLLEDIKNGCCHYPVGDTRPIKFCGLPRSGHPNYCEEHAACVADKSEEAKKLVERTSTIPIEKRILRKS
jgi:hypothetical protein